MNTTLTIIITLAVLFFVGGMYRNVRVFRFRASILNRIHELNQQEIIARDYTELLWRYECYESVSYDEMMVKFWVPLKPERWFKDTSFLK